MLLTEKRIKPEHTNEKKYQTAQIDWLKGVGSMLTIEEIQKFINDDAASDRKKKFKMF